MRCVALAFCTSMLAVLLELAVIGWLLTSTELLWLCWDGDRDLGWMWWDLLHL